VSILQKNLTFLCSFIAYKDNPGYYRIELISESPNETQYGEITEKYIRLLEYTIRQRPEFWLWSHKRWKHKVELDS
jgi:KDO2-lipid IV(A) lauroyltransferase